MALASRGIACEVNGAVMPSAAGTSVKRRRNITSEKSIRNHRLFRAVRMSNLPIVIACGLDFSEKNPLLKENNNKAFFLLLFI